jgi:hypothetical protein
VDEIRAGSGRGRGEAVVLRRHVREQISQRPARARRRPGQISGTGPRHDLDAGQHGPGVQPHDVGAGFLAFLSAYLIAYLWGGHGCVCLLI